MTINIILNITNKILCQETPKSMLMASACQHKLVSTQQLEKIEEQDHEKVLLSILNDHRLKSESHSYTACNIKFSLQWIM